MQRAKCRITEWNLQRNTLTGGASPSPTVHQQRLLVGKGLGSFRFLFFTIHLKLTGLIHKKARKIHPIFLVPFDEAPSPLAGYGRSGLPHNR